MDKPKMYRITSPIDLYVPFTKGLLTEAQSKDWEDYKAEEVKGKSEEEIRFLKRDVEAVRLQRWATAKGLGSDPVQDKIRSGEETQIPTGYTPQNKFCLPKGESIVSEKIMLELKRFEKKEIKQTLRPGETKAKINYEGFLEIEPLTEEEIIALDNKKKK
jgi:hypothetical protein